jgi:hypothetical protein
MQHKWHKERNFKVKFGQRPEQGYSNEMVVKFHERDKNYKWLFSNTVGNDMKK